MYRKIVTITILIAGIMFTAGLMAGFGGFVFAGDPVPGLHITIEQIPGGRVSTKNYNSSLSNKSVGKVRQEVGDILLRYGVGGADINKVTDALEGGGVYEAELKSFLIAIGINEQGVQKIIVEFDGLGIGINEEGMQAVSTPDAGDTSQSKPYIKIQGIPGKTEAIPTPDTEDIQPRADEVEGLEGPILEELGKQLDRSVFHDTATVKRIELMQNTIGKIQERLKRCDTKVCITVGDHAKKRMGLTTGAEKAIKDGKTEETIQSLRTVKKIVEGDIELLAGVEDKGSIADVLGLERALLRQTDVALKALDTRENAKELRENFRENVKTIIGHVDHGKTARIAVAHGKGLRMLNRFRSAMARFDHILGRLESRVEKLEAQGVDISSVAPFIEKAKNMSVENEAKMEELKAKYESLLLGENVVGIAKEARAIATELKVGIENIRTNISTPDGSVILIKMEKKK